MRYASIIHYVSFRPLLYDTYYSVLCKAFIISDARLSSLQRVLAFCRNQLVARATSNELRSAGAVRTRAISSLLVVISNRSIFSFSLAATSSSVSSSGRFIPVLAFASAIAVPNLMPDILSACKV